MFTFMRQAGAAAVPVNVWAVKDPASTGNTLALPAHQANDVIIVFARGTGATVPSLPAGWTNIASLSMTFTNSHRLFYIKDTTNSITTVTVGSANMLFAVCFRGVASLGVAVATAETGPITSMVLPTISPITSPGASRVFSVLNINQGNALMVDPAGLTRRLDNLIPNISGGELVLYDSGGVSSFSGFTTTWTPSAYGAAISVEMIP